MTDKGDPTPPLEWMTEAEQIRIQTEGLEGMPGFVVVPPTIPRPYERDEHGQWRQVDEPSREKGEEQS